MTAITKAAIRGIFYMVIIAVVFGAWQRDFLAGLFMFLFLLFIEKMFRVVINLLSSS